MADTTTKIQGPVELKDNSAERVAFDLFMFIQADKPEQQDKYLELYARCLITTKNPHLGLETVKKRAQGH